jgi:hypothetical protein
MSKLLQTLGALDHEDRSKFHNMSSFRRVSSHGFQKKEVYRDLELGGDQVAAAVAHGLQFLPKRRRHITGEDEAVCVS